MNLIKYMLVDFSHKYYSYIYLLFYLENKNSILFII